MRCSSTGPGSRPNNMIGEPGEGWPLAMTVVSHEREPGELGYVARYGKVVNDLTRRVRSDPGGFRPEQVRDLGWAMVEVEMLRLHVRRRLSDRLDGIAHGPEGSVDKLLMTWTEQAVGHAALAIGGSAHGGGDDTWLNTYLYSRAQSVMGGTSQIQRNLVARRILGLPGPSPDPSVSAADRRTATARRKYHSVLRRSMLSSRGRRLGRKNMGPVPDGQRRTWRGDTVRGTDDRSFRGSPGSSADDHLRRPR